LIAEALALQQTQRNCRNHAYAAHAAVEELEGTWHDPGLLLEEHGGHTR